mmetsp:Transcript_20269/g.54130  ORF Transcript_20269/g.54130 Transcript_20269/m.54130 type:complete len:303 (+) Transcript_20269:392-1300(+)
METVSGEGTRQDVSQAIEISDLLPGDVPPSPNHPLQQFGLLATHLVPDIVTDNQLDLREPVQATQLQEEIARIGVADDQPSLLQQGDKGRHLVQVDGRLQAVVLVLARVPGSTAHPAELRAAMATFHVTARVHPLNGLRATRTPLCQRFLQCLDDLRLDSRDDSPSEFLTSRFLLATQAIVKRRTCTAGAALHVTYVTHHPRHTPVSHPDPVRTIGCRARNHGRFCSCRRLHRPLQQLREGWLRKQGSQLSMRHWLPALRHGAQEFASSVSHLDLTPPVQTRLAEPTVSTRPQPHRRSRSRH